MDSGSPPGSSVPGILQARILEYFLLQVIFPTQGIEPGSLTSPALAGRLFTTSTTWAHSPWGCKRVGWDLTAKQQQPTGKGVVPRSRPGDLSEGSLCSLLWDLDMTDSPYHRLFI